MGRYADLTFIAEAEVPERPGDFVARETWLSRFLVAAVLLGLGCGVPVFAAVIAVPEFGGLAGLWERTFIELAAFGIGGLIVIVKLFYTNMPWQCRIFLNETGMINFVLNTYHKIKLS